MRPLFASVLLPFVALSSCVEPPPPKPAAAPPRPSASPLDEARAAPPPRDNGRLPANARPIRYVLSLDVDPGAERFTGEAKIDVVLTEPAAHVVLHGRDLTVLDVQATVEAPPGDAPGDPRRAPISGSASLRPAHGGTHPEELVLTFPAKLPAGKVSLRVRYSAPFASDLAGIYRVKDRDRWYAFTQFEAVDARRAFPCFDEPTFKTPFDVTISAPRGMTAVSNTAEVERTEREGRTVFRFATTRPLPTYLVALAVGELDIRQGPSEPAPLRLIATKGRAEMGQTALDATAALVKILGDYFEVKYPFDKLDIVAVPDFAAGAMENPGLVTFREEILLVDKDHVSQGQLRRQAATIAHELAHQWFGDLVTADWWDDIWLNEGFATWMEAKALDRYRPAFGAGMESVADRLHVMDQDALRSARAVREPVRTSADAMAAFDGITYDKGAAVLGMIERWIGEKAFQTGVRDYVRANAWKSAKADDLLRALDLASNRDVSKLASTFLDRRGVPVVGVTWTCDGKQLHLDLAQSPWAPLGAEARDPKEAGPWTIPFCAQVEGIPEKVCLPLARETARHSVGVARCPAWVYPNAGEGAYYRWSLREPELRRVTKDLAKLEPPARVGLLANAWAMTRAGKLGAAAMVEVLRAFDGETDRYAVEHVVAILHAARAALVDHEGLGESHGAAPARFRQFALERLARHKRTLGWTARAGEPSSQTLLRRPVLSALGELAEDEATLREADALAQAWLKDPRKVDPDTASIAVELGSRRAGLERLDALRARAKSAKTPGERAQALRGTGGFGDAAVLRQALDWVLTDDVKPSEIQTVLGSASAHYASRAVVRSWVQANWDRLLAKLGRQHAFGLASLVGDTCTPKEREAAAAFFVPHVKELDGAARLMDETLEASALCVALRAEVAGPFGRALARDTKNP